MLVRPGCAMREPVTMTSEIVAYDKKQLKDNRKDQRWKLLMTTENVSLEPKHEKEFFAEVAFPECGAIASFIGTVRNHSRDRDVEYLEYEAFEEMADAMLDRLGRDLTQKYSLRAIAIHHRVGRVEIGEPSVVIATSAPHRADALDACREAIETLKATIPLWKKEIYAGGEEWIGRGS